MIGQPCGLYLKGTRERFVGVHGTSELGLSVPLKRHIGDCLTEQDITICIQRLDSHIHGLLVGGEE